jgi:hypothetical protein
MNHVTVATIRDRAHHVISYETARAGGMSYEELRQFVSYTRRPTDEQLAKLARHFGVRIREEAGHGH